MTAGVDILPLFAVIIRGILETPHGLKAWVIHLEIFRKKNLEKNFRKILNTGVCPLQCGWDPIMQVHFENTYFLQCSPYGLLDYTGTYF